ncbi:hypothetical protein [Rhodococcus sp. (in: high G+C Gram-positive bacteria)]|uniref:hypothetical protein n=1 Tax=Rhodococcus sp. TaxID=1831 RepID=UPI0032617018
MSTPTGENNMNAYRTIDTTDSDMIVMGASADHAREVATQILQDLATDHPNMIGSKTAIATVASI